MSLYVNRIRYKGGSPTLAASSGIINNAVLNGHDFYDDDYNPAPPAHDYSLDYFTVEPIDGGNITLRFTKTGKPSSISVKYSTDGVNWGSMGTSGSVTLTGKVYLRATTDHWGGSSSKYWKFNILQDYKVYGNIMSLLYGDNFLNQTTLKNNEYEFYHLFDSSTHLVDAENLILPATTLTNYCYQGMFNNCTKLTTAPELPATTLARYCYAAMFQGCTSLTTAPELPATTLASYCYSSMFSGCTALIHTPSILPATTLAQYCYSYMFSGCGLTTAPELPATSLLHGCYQNMFNNCTSLTTAPELLADTLATQCYADMFYGCTLLNKITCLATNISATSCTNTWVSGVSETGTFIKNQSMSSWPSGASGIPSGWTVQDYAA